MTEPNLNANSDKIKELIDDPKFQEQGYSLDVVVYSIAGSPLQHTNIELMKDGQFVTSFDLWSLNRKNELINGAGDATLYEDDEKLAPVMDDNKEDNFVVKPENEVARSTLVSGTGMDVLVPLAKMSEFTAHAEKQNLNYEKWPEKNQKNESNSNGMAFALVEHAGFPMPDEITKATSENSVGIDTTPGKDDNLRGKIWPQGKSSAYDAYDSDPQALLKDKNQMKQFYDDLDAIDLNKQQKDLKTQAAETEASKPSSVPRP
ncbi:MAG: hypothetical protein WBK77_00225 [Alphaproteobacteria bacterium]